MIDDVSAALKLALDQLAPLLHGKETLPWKSAFYLYCTEPFSAAHVRTVPFSI